MKIGAFIVPTGIGASIGGFAGDASKWARKLSKKCKLIVNPNVVNAACFSGITDSMLYVEGYSMDEFFKGQCFLKESVNNKIGLILDKSIPQDVLNVHINTVNAVKTVYDIDISKIVITDEPVGVSFFINSAGASTGNVKNVSTIYRAAKELLESGCNAIAIVCLFPEGQEDDYAAGIGVDPVGGVEAIISHYISQEFKVPCAHAPAFSSYEICSDIVSPKCSAEYITPTFLPCILIGLQNAPQITQSENCLGVNDVDFIVLPYNALGSIPVMEMMRRGKKVFAIKENSTVLNVNAQNFNIKCDIINTYEELLELIC
jgi:hypothetical protein